MLLMSRTPLRVSLFGGGTDYPEYFDRRPGAVVGMAINKYINIVILRLTAFQEYNYRVSYSRLELCSSAREIAHPVVREVLGHLGIADRLDISCISDLPSSGSGLGSSSAFTVGFLRAVYGLSDHRPTKIDLARKAIVIERDVLKENVGVQDQLHAAFGGLNRFDFVGSSIRITPIQMSGETMDAFNASLVLVHTGIARSATAIVAEQIAATRNRTIDAELADLYHLVGACVDLLEAQGLSRLAQLGALLSDSWRIKRRLSKSVSSETLDDIFGAIAASGAYGAKLCGAGGGGFFFALIDPDRVASLRARVAPLAVIPVAIDVDGSTLVYRQSA